MKETTLDRNTLFLVSNGDVSAVSSQSLYEYAWKNGIRPLKEEDLKPDLLSKKRRRGPRIDIAGRMSGNGC